MTITENETTTPTVNGTAVHTAYVARTPFSDCWEVDLWDKWRCAIGAPTYFDTEVEAHAYAVRFVTA